LNACNSSIALCIPAYNAEKFLPRLLASAAKQRVPFAEVLVHDDCSKDRTAEIARQLGATVLRGEKNVGCSAGKNALLRSATAEWIHFHDADDELLPNFTALATKWIGRTDVPDVVLFDFEYRDNDTGELIAKSDFRDDALRADPIRYSILNQINPFCGLYRRERLLQVGGYDLEPEILYNEDVAFHCKLAVTGLTFRAEKEVSIINYRVNGSMSQANQVKCLKAHSEVMWRVAAQVGKSYGPELSQRFWKAATGLASHGQWEAALEALQRAEQLSSQIPKDQSRLFTALCRVLTPARAFRLREALIRAFKPQLRQGNKGMNS
jgi:glycosyltransferase involved in cell wall biosynthesis